MIDGYNLIFSLIESNESLQLMRQKIICYLQKKFATKKFSGILVFDGTHMRDEESGLSYKSPLVIAYAPKGYSADKYIIEQIEIAENPKEVTVVTNDKGLILHAKSAGAKVMANNTLIQQLNKKKRTSSKIELKESPKNIERLEKIFEERLKPKKGD